MVVLKYLQKRGFKRASFSADAKLSKDATSSMSLVALGADAALSDLLVFIARGRGGRCKIDADLRWTDTREYEWIFGALDLYKSELMKSCFNVCAQLLTLVKKIKWKSPETSSRGFTRTTSGLPDYIRGLSGIALPEHVDTDPYVKFIKHKFSIEMCFQSFDLLVRFLRASDGNGAKCLAILNENVGVKITQKDSPSMFVEEEEEKNMDEIFSGVVTGETTASIAAYNSGPGRFGLLEQSLEIKAERAFRNRAKHEDAVKREDARVAAYKPKKVYKKRKRKIRTAKTTMTRRRRIKKGKRFQAKRPSKSTGIRF